MNKWFKVKIKNENKVNVFLVNLKGGTLDNAATFAADYFKDDFDELIVSLVKINDLGTARKEADAILKDKI